MVFANYFLAKILLKNPMILLSTFVNRGIMLFSSIINTNAGNAKGPFKNQFQKSFSIAFFVQCVLIFTTITRIQYM